MNLQFPVWSVSAALGLALGLSGCGDREDHDHQVAGAHESGGHVHQPKYGGQLVELGSHEGNIELVLDAAAGKLTLYVLDAHAENFVRLPLGSITLVAETSAGTQTLRLNPVGNAATGEKPGDTSQFEATADWLKSAPAFTVRIQELPVKSKTYRDLTFRLPK